MGRVAQEAIESVDNLDVQRVERDGAVRVEVADKRTGKVLWRLAPKDTARLARTLRDSAQQPTATDGISPRGAKLACRRPWSTEEGARTAAERLERAGWHIDWRQEPVEYGEGSGVWVVASVHVPITGDCLGDITFEAVRGG